MTKHTAPRNKNIKELLVSSVAVYYTHIVYVVNVNIIGIKF